MRDVIEWWYVRRMVRRSGGWCVMRYMDQVRVDGFGAGEALAEISLADVQWLLGLLQRVADDVEREGVERGRAAGLVADLRLVYRSALEDLYDVV